MKHKEKTYNFKLYEEDLTNEPLIQRILKAISTLPLTHFSYVIVELFEVGSKKGIAFFQTTRHRTFKETDYYTFDIRVDNDSSGKNWTMYEKNLQTKEQVLKAFEEICIRRIFPDLSNWETFDINFYESETKKKNCELAYRTLDGYYHNRQLTDTDLIKYWESLRYFTCNSNNYSANESVLLANLCCEYGEFKIGKEIYEAVTYAACSTYHLANLIMSGVLGKPDYKLAYEYYKHTCLLDNLHYLSAKIQIAKMHRDGKYFKPNYEIYRRIIKSAEKEYLMDTKDLCTESLYYELALIALHDEKIEQAINYCSKSRYWINRLIDCGSEKKFLILGYKVVKLWYKLTEYNKDDILFCDLLYLLNEPCKITFAFYNSIYTAECTLNDERPVIELDGKYYNGTFNFFLKATLDGRRILPEADKITIIEVQQ